VTKIHVKNSVIFIYSLVWVLNTNLSRTLIFPDTESQCAVNSDFANMVTQYI